MGATSDSCAVNAAGCHNDPAGHLDQTAIPFSVYAETAASTDARSAIPASRLDFAAADQDAATVSASASANARSIKYVTLKADGGDFPASYRDKTSVTPVATANARSAVSAAGV